MKFSTAQKKAQRADNPAKAVRSNLDGNEHIVLVNLTPHPVKFFTHNRISEEFELEFDMEKCEEPARVESNVDNIGMVSGVPIRSAENKCVHNLPDPEDGVYYIVSSCVRQFVNRDDLLSPRKLVRNRSGDVLGASELMR